MELALNIAAIVISLAATVISLRRRHVSRSDELKAIGEEAVLVASRTASPGIPVDRVALETAILLDVQKDGKKDYTRAQLWSSVQAAMARQGIK